MSDDRMPFIVCGRAIGTATGWDQGDTFAMTLYGFEPSDGYAGPVGDILFSFENGTIESFDDDGNVVSCVDLIDAVKGCPVERAD